LCHGQLPSAAAIGYLPRRSATVSLAPDESCKLAAVLILANIAFVCAFLGLFVGSDLAVVWYGQHYWHWQGKNSFLLVAKLELQLMNFLMTEKIKMVQKM